MNRMNAIQLFERELDRLAREVNAYSDEDLMWITKHDVNNSGGNLAMHLCGNLQHFIGHIIGKSDYVRNREFEFAGRLTRQEIIQEIDVTKSAVKKALENMPDELASETYPIEVLGHPMTYDFFIDHLYGHLTYHIGQISYHRRLIKNK